MYQEAVKTEYKTSHRKPLKLHCQVLFKTYNTEAHNAKQRNVMEDINVNI